MPCCAVGGAGVDDNSFVQFSVRKTVLPSSRQLRFFQRRIPVSNRCDGVFLHKSFGCAELYSVFT